MSKVDLMPMPPAEIREGLYSVIAGALAGGAPEPSWVAVDDGSNSWVVEVSTRPVSERVHGVVAAANDNAIVAAQRLGVGGAMWLPPSSLGALDAFTAAAAAEAPITIDAASFELHDGATTNHVVTIVDTLFWKVQLGDRALEAQLSELAVALGAPAALLGWPALVVADRDPEAILSTWEELASKSGTLRPSLEVTSMRPESLENGLFEAAYPKLVGGGASETPGGQMTPQPVHELPHGRRIGWWRMGEGEEPEGEGWIATPTVEKVTRCRWHIDGDDDPGPVEEVLAADEVMEAGDVVAVRIPGWASCGLRTGSPAGLLAARIADAATRRGLPLWIPGVDEEALRFVLGLPGTIWVDGPAVPS